MLGALNTNTGSYERMFGRSPVDNSVDKLWITFATPVESRWYWYELPRLHGHDFVVVSVADMIS